MEDLLKYAPLVIIFMLLIIAAALDRLGKQLEGIASILTDTKDANQRNTDRVCGSVSAVEDEVSGRRAARAAPSARDVLTPLP